MLGLFVFFYVVLHFLTLHLVRPWASTSHDIAKDIAKRPFITVGFSAFVLLMPLAATRSTARSRRWAPSAGRGCTG